MKKVECVVCGAIVNKYDTYVSNFTLDDYTCIEWIELYNKQAKDISEVIK